jgi:hypothetical protein
MVYSANQIGESLIPKFKNQIGETVFTQFNPNISWTHSIGILLCKEKDDNIVELTLSKEANIYASEYNLYLPDKALLQQKMQEWADEYEKKQINALF